MTTLKETIQTQPSETRFPLADLPLERIVKLAKEQRAAYIAGLFAAGQARLAAFSKRMRSIAPTSMIRHAEQA